MDSDLDTVSPAHETNARTLLVSLAVKVTGVASARNEPLVSDAATVPPLVAEYMSWCARASVTIDRKSTRLNSSHVAISYAVFCLKKKNKTHRNKTAHG